MTPSPAEEYAHRLEARQAACTHYERLHIAIGNWRLALAAAAAVLAWIGLWNRLISPAWALIPAAAFIVLVVVHARVLERRRAGERAAAHYERGLARLEDRWIGSGETGERFLEESHPYAEDLDIFGKGSLFELLSTARTRSGEQTLARWLCHASPWEDLRARHAAIEELRPMLDLREDLAVLGEDVRLGVHPEALAGWGQGPPLLDSRRDRLLAAILPCLLIASLVAWLSFNLRPVFLVVLMLHLLFGFRLRQVVRRVLVEVEPAAHDLALLAAVLERLERERFQSPLLAGLRAALETGGRPPSHRIARFNRLMELLDSRENLLVRIIEPVVLWTMQFCFAIEAWRKRYGPALRGWLDAVGEMEALSALAGYADEHPSDPFPEFSSQAPCFEGDGLGHPLLPDERFVRNDVHLAPGLRLLVVSGSNMSGKSTLLRTVGINAVLAMAGAPVRARRLRLSPVNVGASIRVLDSLQGGVSRFYAQITRLRQLLDLTGGAAPLLFLLDELLHGTNSHDRRIGAEAYVKGLLDRGAFGLITTHDLALAHIADALESHAANVHFQDHLENGKMTFDYLMRPGVVTKSNALELMRSVGLEV